MRCLGADPGAGGALAVIEDGVLASIYDMPAHPAMLAQIIGNLLPLDLALVEQVHSMPINGHIGNFKLGNSLGKIEMALAFAQVPMRWMPPKEWQAFHKLTNPKLSKKQRKDLSRQRASELFPEWAGWFSRVRDDGRAEAALIAYCGLHQPTSGMVPVHANRKTADIDGGGLV